MEAEAALLWRRLAAAALALFIAAATFVQIRSVDTFWHLAAGREILTSGALLEHDPFRFTHDGIEWVDHEWAFQVSIALAERLAGDTGLTLARAVFVAFAALAVWWPLRRRGTPAGATALVTLAVLIGARPRFFLRPELATFAGLALLLALLARYRHTARRWPIAAAMAALTAIWSNFHPGVLVAPAVAGAYLLGAWFPQRSAEEPTQRLGLAEVFLLPAALALAAAANPWGFAVYHVPFEIAAALADLPATNPDWAPLLSAPRPFLLVVAVLLALVLGAAWRKTRRLDAAAALALLALLPLAFLTARNVGLALIAAAHLAGAALADLADRGALPRWLTGRRGAVLAVAAAVLGMVWCLAPPRRGPLAPRVRFEPGIGIEQTRFPRTAVDQLERWEPVGNLLNSAAFGGYLLWRTYPPRQIFLDTRNEVDPGFLATVGRARSDEGLWLELLAEHAIDAALARYDDRPRPVESAPERPGEPPRTELHTPSSYLFPSERFALVYWDDVAMLFLARTPEREAALAEHQYRAVQPEDWRATLERARRDPAFHEQVRRELGRRLREEPPSRRAEGIAAALAGLTAAPQPLEDTNPTPQENP